MSTETNQPETAPKHQEDVQLPEVAQALAESKYDLEYPYVPLSAMNPAPYNPREITDEASAALEDSLDKFGLVQPIVWNKRTGNIVGGHQKYKILVKRGVKESKTCIVDLDETEEKLLNVTLNNPAAQGQWNMKALADIVKVLKSKKTAAEFKLSGLESLAKQLPLFDGVKETSSSDTPKKKMTEAEAAGTKLEKADIKMLQLFYSTEQHRKVMEWVAGAAEACGTDNASDTVFKLLEAFNAGREEEKAKEVAVATTEEVPAEEPKPAQA